VYLKTKSRINTLTPISQELVEIFKIKVGKSLNHLRYSFAKIQTLSTDPKLLHEDQLETWESFASRFARASDLFTTKLLRALILADDPGFTGSFRDILDRSEKLGLICSADEWMKIRALRNVSVHEYSDTDLSLIFAQLRELTPTILACERLL
jgi:hypothetical protein